MSTTAGAPTGAILGSRPRYKRERNKGAKLEIVLEPKSGNGQIVVAERMLCLLTVRAWLR